MKRVMYKILDSYPGFVEKTQLELLTKTDTIFQNMSICYLSFLINARFAIWMDITSCFFPLEIEKIYLSWSWGIKYSEGNGKFLGRAMAKDW